MNFYRSFVRPIFFGWDAEVAHHFTMGCLERFGGLLSAVTPALDKGLEKTVFGVKFPGPLGLAAGMDKNAVALPAWQGLGFGFAEIGTVTAKGQPGNPLPRLFRYPEIEAVVNRFGFNNEGAKAVALRLAALRESGAWPQIPVGVNLGKSKVTPLEEANEDYMESFRLLRSFGDYFVLNVSSPNTPGLRKLQDSEALKSLLKSVQSVNVEARPVLLKIAPDLEWSAIEEIISLVEEHGLAGMIATNTTIDHSVVAEQKRQQGGLSGKPLKKRSLEVLKFIAERTKLPVIGVGGIANVDDALERIDSGAALIQVYTALVYEGPALIRAIHNALLVRCRFA